MMGAQQESGWQQAFGAALRARVGGNSGARGALRPRGATIDECGVGCVLSERTKAHFDLALAAVKVCIAAWHLERGAEAAQYAAARDAAAAGAAGFAAGGPDEPSGSAPRRPRRAPREAPELP